MIMRSNQSIGEIIRYFRLIKNISQKELAEYLNVTESAVSSWERGLTKPGLDIAMKLSKDMQMSLEEFYFLPAQNLAEDHEVELFQTLKLTRGYLDVTHIGYDPQSSSLRVDLSIRGMTIDATYIQSEIDFSMHIKGERSRPYQFEIFESHPEKILLSPELESIPLGSTTIQFSYYFNVPELSHIKFIIRENGHLYEMGIEEEVLGFILQNQSIDMAIHLSPSLIDKITKAFLFIFKSKPEDIPKYLSHYLTLEKGHD
jgi:transcriptional regulator with XRE-family HTH domain